MRNKKLFSTVMATTLAVTTMAMPVMAAQRGELDVDVTDKAGVLRVQVPTTLAVEIDPYEIVEEGCQIVSGNFTMTNLSEMDVKVEVSSKVTSKNNKLSLVSNREDAVTSETEGEAWLAVAAKTSLNGNASGDAYQDGTATTYAELTEANANVTTFDASGDAQQTFYLGKASGDATNMKPVYKQIVPVKSGDAGLAYAEFYELAEESSVNDDDTLTAAAAENDIYIARSGDAGKNDAILVNIPKGHVASGDCVSGDTYYAVSGDAAVLGKNVVAGTSYVYAEMPNAGGEAGFRYVGNLSSAKAKEWSKEDISKIAINYTIGGVSKSNYKDIVDKCVYGLYTAGPRVSITPGGVITITGLSPETDPIDMNLIDVADNKAYNLTSQSSTWTATGSAAEGTIVVRLGQDWYGLANKEVKIQLDLKDGSEISGTTTLGTAPAAN